VALLAAFALASLPRPATALAAPSLHLALWAAQGMPDASFGLLARVAWPYVLQWAGLLARVACLGCVHMGVRVTASITRRAPDERIQVHVRGIDGRTMLLTLPSSRATVGELHAALKV
jgi:hypothetical protein